jgi:predicted Zn-dependent protease
VPPGSADEAFCELARGAAEYRKGDIAAAAIRLERLSQNTKSDRWILQFPGRILLAMAQQRHGEQAKARATLAESDSLWASAAPASVSAAGPEWHDWLMCQILRREAEELIVRGKRSASEVPKNWKPWTDDAEMCAIHGETNLFKGKRREAAEAFVRAVALNPNDLWLSYKTAPLLALADSVAYESHRRHLLDRWGNADDAQTCERVSKACLLRPWSGEDLDRAARLAERAVRAINPGQELVPFLELAAALAEYRKGAFAEAERRLDVLIARGEPQWNVTVPAWSLLALTRHQLGKSGAAQQALAHAADRWKSLSVHLNSSNPNAWHDLLIGEVLYREADETVTANHTSSEK